MDVDSVPHSHPVSTDSGSSGNSSSSCSPRTPLYCDPTLDRTKDVHRRECISLFSFLRKHLKIKSHLYTRARTHTLSGVTVDCRVCAPAVADFNLRVLDESLSKTQSHTCQPEVGKLRPRGHMWPDEPYNPARRAFTIISPKAK